MKDFTEKRGIEGVGGREPLLARINIGERNARGFPQNFIGDELVGFTIMMPHATRGERGWSAEKHPMFAFFNGANPRSKRYQLSGVIVHATEEECFSYQLKAQKIKGLASGNRPACVGDGVRAMRWDNERGDYSDIQCPHERCQYRLTNPASCKPFMRLVFMLHWPGRDDLPTGLVKITSQGWGTIQNAKGLFDHVRKAARDLGLESYTLIGLPIQLVLEKKTSTKNKGSRFPVVAFSLRMAAHQFFAQQRSQLDQVGGKYPSLQDMSSPEEIAYDIETIEVPAR